MKKLVLFLLTGFIVLSFSTFVHAEGAYFSGNIGAAILSDGDITDSTVPGVTVEYESDTGIAVGTAVGYAYSNNIRTEIELVYQKNDFDTVSALGVKVDASGDTSSLAGLLNFYYDFVNNSSFIPFITAGIGYAKVEVDDLSVAGILIGSDDDKVFAYQVGAGVGYAVSETLIFDLKYRYFATSDPEFDTTESEYASNNVYVGLRVSF